VSAAAKPPASAGPSLAEKQAALSSAASLLVDRVSPVALQLTVEQGPCKLYARACWLWPGVVRVMLRHSGELIAQSLPGEPAQLDSEATAAEVATLAGNSLARQFTVAEKQAALQAASRLLQAQARPVVCRIKLGFGAVWAPPGQAAWSWPGVVTVKNGETGALLFASVPGLPEVPDEAGP
jgi:hypothetical protein